MTLTIDSSVFVAAFVKSEPSSDKAFTLLTKVIRENLEVVIPITVLIESTLAVARRAGQSLALDVQDFILDLPNLKLIEVTLDAALQTIDFGSKLSLKGMDAIVVYVAKEFNTVLATLDQEMVKKSMQEVKCYF